MGEPGAGAGSGNRTRVFSLEGCCTTIVLYPRGDCVGPEGPPQPTRYGVRSVVSKARGGGSRTRTCEAYAGDLQSPPFAARDIPPARFRTVGPMRRRPFGRRNNKSSRVPASPGLGGAPDPKALRAPNRRASYSVEKSRTQRPEIGQKTGIRRQARRASGRGWQARRRCRQAGPRRRSGRRRPARPPWRRWRPRLKQHGEGAHRRLLRFRGSVAATSWRLHRRSPHGPHPASPSAMEPVPGHAGQTL